MRLLELPIRLLLALTLGLLPVLCCCGEASADTVPNEAPNAAAVQPVEVMAGDHACCGAEDIATPPTDQHRGDQHREDCTCGKHQRTMQEVRAETSAIVPPMFSHACFWLAPLPLPLLIAPVDADRLKVPLSASVLGSVPPAPSLRTLSVLLLT